METSGSSERDGEAQTRMWLQVSTVERSSTASLSSQVDLDVRQLFTQVGSYRGTLIAVKHINRKSVDLTRAVRKELKLVRRLIVISVYIRITVTVTFVFLRPPGGIAIRRVCWFVRSFVRLQWQAGVR